MPGGPFNVGSGGFPASFITIDCGPHTVSSRSQLRSDASQAAGNAAFLLAQFVPSATITWECTNGREQTSTVARAAASLADLAAMLNAYDRHLDLPHAGPEGPRGPEGPAGTAGTVGPTGAMGLAGFVGPAGELPTLGTPDFSSLLQTLAVALGSLTGRAPTTGGVQALLPALPPTGAAPAAVLSRVDPGGTVNVPVVPGSTSDPSGTRVPDFPDTTRERLLEILRLLGPQFLTEIQARRAQRRARDLIAAQLDAFRAALAARRAQLDREARQRAGGTTMPFGQAGVSFIDPGNGGRDFLDDLIRAGREFLFPRDTGPRFDDPFPAPPQLPPPVQLPGQQPAFPPAAGIPGLVGGGVSCPSLFRTGAGVSTRARPVGVVCLPNPLTGEAEFFGSLGKPLIFARDVKMAKSIPKLIRKLGGHTSKAAHRKRRKR